MINGNYRLMHSNLEGPVNIGCPNYISVDELAHTFSKVIERRIHINHANKVVEVHYRNSFNNRISSIGCLANYYEEDKIRHAFLWIQE